MVNDFLDNSYCVWPFYWLLARKQITSLIISNILFRLFGTKCEKCRRSFGKNDFVMRAKNKIFHLVSCRQKYLEHLSECDQTYEKNPLITTKWRLPIFSWKNRRDFFLTIDLFLRYLWTSRTRKAFKFPIFFHDLQNSSGLNPKAFKIKFVAVIIELIRRS